MMSGSPDTNRICERARAKVSVGVRFSQLVFRRVGRVGEGEDSNVSECDQGSVKEHDDAQQHEKGAERRQADLSPSESGQPWVRCAA
jgi:hypothetical protein